jgi:hypothetical protein
MPSSSDTFRNLIEYSSYHFPFVDRYSQFGVTFEAGRPIGLGMAQVRSAIHTFQVTCETLRLWVEEAGQHVPVQRTELESLPWCATERAAVGSVAVSARHVFLDEVTLASEFSFANNGTTAVTLRPVWLGQFSGDRFRHAGDSPSYGYAELPLRETWAEVDGASLRGGLRSSRGVVVLPLPALQVTSSVDDGLAVTLSNSPLWGGNAQATERQEGLVGRSIFYALQSEPFALAAGGRSSFRFVAELSVASYLDPKQHFRRLRPATIDMDAAIENSRQAFEARVGLADAPAGSEDRPALQSRLWRSRWALLRTGYRGRGKAGEYGQGLASTCVPSCSGFTKVFFWDSLFSAVALARFEPQLAAGAISAVFSRQLESGYCPEHSFNYHVPNRDVIGAPQAPVASWAVERYLACRPDDTAFLEAIYPKLSRNHRYWQECADRDRDGLAEWTWSGQTADDSPLFDECRTSPGCGWLPPIASVQLNAFLYSDGLTLAGLAGKLGRAGEAELLREGARLRSEALMRVCYVPEEKRFWDYNHATQRHSRIRTFYLFWPIWAGMDLPADVKKDLIENVLLDPRQFFGDVPFPSVAYDEPSYDPRGYWRGRCWPHISYWLLEMLVREGYADAADKAAARLLAAWSREASCVENLATDPGLYDAGGSPDYNWGAAAVYLIGTGEYRKAQKRDVEALSR